MLCWTIFGLSESAAGFIVPASCLFRSFCSLREIAHARAYEIRAALAAHSLSSTFRSNRERHAAVAVAVLHPYGFCVDPQSKRNGPKRGAAKQPFDHKLPRSISQLADSRLRCGLKRDFRKDHMPMLALYQGFGRKGKPPQLSMPCRWAVAGYTAKWKVNTAALRRPTVRDRRTTPAHMRPNAGRVSVFGVGMRSIAAPNLAENWDSPHTAAKSRG
jgi:hypothetical protein